MQANKWCDKIFFDNPDFEQNVTSCIMIASRHQIRLFQSHNVLSEIDEEVKVEPKRWLQIVLEL